jgi:lysozyme
MKRADAEKLLNHPNIRAFLAMIGESEGANYQTLVHAGRKNSAIKDLSRHPNKLMGSGRLRSTAAGRYQFLYRTWIRFEKSLGLTDFSPKSQDLAAVAQLAEVGAIQPILQGNIELAIKKSNKIWASFTGSPYNQNPHPISKMLNWYRAAADGVSANVATKKIISDNAGTATGIIVAGGLTIILGILLLQK